MAVCSQVHTRHTNTLCGQNAESVPSFLAMPTVTRGAGPVHRPHPHVAALCLQSLPAANPQLPFTTDAARLKSRPKDGVSRNLDVLPSISHRLLQYNFKNSSLTRFYITFRHAAHCGHLLHRQTVQCTVSKPQTRSRFPWRKIDTVFVLY
jgi:hypothetical protein